MAEALLYTVAILTYLVLAPLIVIFGEIKNRIKSMKSHRSIFTFFYKFACSIVISIISVSIVFIFLTSNQISVFQNPITLVSGDKQLEFTWALQLFQKPDINVFWWWFMWGIYIFAGAIVILFAFPYFHSLNKQKLKHIGVPASSIGEYLSMSEAQLKHKIRFKYKKAGQFQIRGNSAPIYEFQRDGLNAEKQFKIDHKAKHWRQEVNLSNNNFNGFADYIGNGKIYEIKSTKYPKSSNKLIDKMKSHYSLQLMLYLYLSKNHTEGEVVVYTRSKKTPKIIWSKPFILSEVDRNRFAKLEERIIKVKAEIYEETHKHFKLYK